ncbi:MAG: tripartite tricarboxylate transporter substrate binding protein, partial [Burkholderiales bacterium]
MNKLWTILAAPLFAIPALHVLAQNYPTKPIRMVVPFAPGGTGEFLSRSITPRMGELIGQQFIVDFRGGAGTTLAAGLVA